MVKHLKEHRVHSKDAVALADQWRYALNKKVFSCGFCVIIFSTKMDRWNHIDKDHWRHGQDMSSWDLSNCIRGLLLEGRLQAAWRFLLRSHPDVVESSLRWEMPTAEGLQLRLETLVESVTVLARAALTLSSYGEGLSSQEALTATSGSPVFAAPRSLTAATVPPSSSIYQPLSDYTPTHASVPRHLPRSLPSRMFETSSATLPTPDCDPSLTSSLTSSTYCDDLVEGGDVLDETFLQIESLMDPNIGDILSQPSPYAWPSDWQAMDTCQHLDDNTRTKDPLNLSESGALLIAQMSLPQHGQQSAYATIDGQAPALNSQNGINTSNTTRSPTSIFHHTSTAQLSDHNYGFNFRNKPLPPEPSTSVPRSSSRATPHRPNTPMDLGIG